MILPGSSAGMGVPTIQGSTSLFSPNMNRAWPFSNSWSKGIMRIRMMRFLRSCANLDS